MLPFPSIARTLPLVVSLLLALVRLPAASADQPLIHTYLPMVSYHEPPPPPSVRVKNSRHLIHQSRWWVMGEVINTLDRPISHVSVEVRLYNAFGEEIGGTTDWTELPKTEAGETASFAILVLDVAGEVAIHEARVRTYTTETAQNHHHSIPLGA